MYTMLKYLIVLIGIILIIVGCGAEQSPTTGVAVSVPEPVQEEPIARGAAPTSPIILIEEVHILGKEGFDPQQITIGVGDTIIWINKDPQGKVAVLTFQKDGSRTFFASKSIQVGGADSFLFEEPGSYTYWTVGYGVRGKVVVE